MFGPGARTHLESLLAERERTTGVQMVIAIFRSLEGENLEDFSIRLAERWRIGQKSLDNGVILLVFVRDRKVRFEVGYGLEQVIPDAVAGQIIREVIAPRFRERRYVEGLEGAINAVFTRVTAAKATPKQPPLLIRFFSTPLGFTVFAVVMFGTFIFVFFLLGKIAERVAYTVGRQGWASTSGSSWGGSYSGGGSFSSSGSSSSGFSGGGGSFGGGGASGGW